MLLEGNVLHDLAPIERIQKLEASAVDAFEKINNSQLPNGTHLASPQRQDSPSFVGGMWVKDSARVARLGTDPYVTQVFPEFNDPEFIRSQGFKSTLTESTIKNLQGLLRIQGQPAQFDRFLTRPYGEPVKDYQTIPDYQVPAIKFTQDGQINYDWNHNQPDNWGSLLLETGRAIEQGFPILDSDEGENRPSLGQIVARITGYLANLRTERFWCRSIWEHDNGWSSYSTRRIVLAGLEQIGKVWPEVVADNNRKLKGHPLEVSTGQIQHAAGSLAEKVAEHFPNDWTDCRNHSLMGDLASLVVANEMELPTQEEAEIILKTAPLENTDGVYRYVGDHFEKGASEAKWTFGKFAIASYYYRQALKKMEQGDLAAITHCISEGLRRNDEMLNVIERVGYLPELFRNTNPDGIYLPNGNELVWGLTYQIRSQALAIASIRDWQYFNSKSVIGSAQIKPSVDRAA